MTTTKTCLLLGKIKDILKLREVILKKKWKVICKNKKISANDLKNIDLVISFNYRHILKKNILKKLKRPAINLHISYLPFNRGSHPNFWSFVENSPKGVTIHEIDEGLDTGPIIYQKKISFNINIKKNNSFFKTQKILNLEIQKLFLRKINQILNKKYITKKQKKNGTFHYEKDLIIFVKKNWKLKIKNVLKIIREREQKVININSNKIFLKKISLSHVTKDYLSWFKDKQVKQYINKKINKMKELKEYVKLQLEKRNTLFFGIFLKKEKIHIGNIKFDLIDKYNNFFWLGILIGNKLYRGRGIGQEVIYKSSEWLFKKKKIKAIFLIVKKKNIIAIKIYKKCKFKITQNLKKTDEYLMVKKNPYIIFNRTKKINLNIYAKK